MVDNATRQRISQGAGARKPADDSLHTRLKARNRSANSKIFSLRQPTVSQQLARLRADGLVSTRRDGKAIYYSLASEEARIIIGAIYDVFCRKTRKR